MNGILNEKVIDKEYQFDKPLIQKIDSMIDNCISDCHNKYFHTFDHIYVYDINFTNFANSEKGILTFSDKKMSLYDLNKKLNIAREYGFLFNQINNFNMKIYSNLCQRNKHYFLKLQTPIMHRQFFRILSQNAEDVQTHCNDRRNLFHFAVRKWYLYNNPQC